MDELTETKLNKCLNKVLRGNWIARNSGYEAQLCDALGWTTKLNRYYDAEYDGLKIEIKKGRNIWLDLLRYSEIAAHRTSEQDTITAFFIPSHDRTYISDIYIVRTARIIDWLNLNEENAVCVLNMPRPPRSLNVQANMTCADVAQIADIHKHFEA